MSRLYSRGPAAGVFTLADRTPRIAEGVFVAPGCFVIGAVTVGRGSSVWYGASVRADLATISIGERTNIQDGCVLHADPDYPLVIGDDVVVGHRAVVHGCTVASRCLIGMGSVIMNGARIEEGSVIAAGAVVPEGATIPPRSLVAGVPGRVRREVSAETVAGISASAARYAELARRHAAALAGPDPD